MLTKTSICTMKKVRILIVAILLFSCNPPLEKFSTAGWKKVADLKSYNHREGMMKDLLKNHLHKGMKYEDVVKLLGITDLYDSPQKDSIQLIYTISEDYEDDIDPSEGKNFVLKFNKDSVLCHYYVEEWEH